jgi:hypothetical protein
VGADHEQLLEPIAADDLVELPIEEVRARRAAATEVETGLSYLRRMVQGAIDIVTRETGHRSGETELSRGDDLLDELPDILGDSGRPAGVGRLSQTLEPTQLDAALEAEYQALVGNGRLARTGQIEDTELQQLREQLTDLEARVSAKRRAYLDQIDLLQAELTRRYQSGEASVDTLLRDAT